MSSKQIAASSQTAGKRFVFCHSLNGLQKQECILSMQARGTSLSVFHFSRKAHENVGSK